MTMPDRPPRHPHSMTGRRHAPERAGARRRLTGTVRPGGALYGVCGQPRPAEGAGTGADGSSG